MISPHLISRIETAFPESVTDRLVAALNEGYEVACENFRPEKGSRSLTFGVDVWAFGTFHLEAVAEEAGFELDTEEHDHRTTLQRDGLYLNCYRVGTSADQNIWECFPNNRNSAPRLAKNNLQFEIFANDQPTGDEPVDLVLAHFGNPNAGLDAVYLCVPIAANQNQISQWGYAKLLWRRDGLAAGGIPTAPPVPLAPEVPIGEPELRLREDESTQTDQ